MEVINQRDVRLVSAEDSLLALIFSLKLSASRRAAAILSWMSLCGDCAMIVVFYKNEDGSESAECAGQFSDALAPKPREGGAPHNEQGEREKAKSEIDGKTA